MERSNGKSLPSSPNSSAPEFFIAAALLTAAAPSGMGQQFSRAVHFR